MKQWMLPAIVVFSLVVPPAKAQPSEEARKPDEVKDGVRMRGGFGIGGGAILTTEDGALGPVFEIQARIGVQINHYFGLIYANSAQLVLTMGGSDVSVGFVDWNTIMPTLTLGHFFDLGVGPSLDYYAIAACNADGYCGTGSTFAFGLHERVAFLIGGLSGNGPRRSGFALGVDFHQAFGENGIIPITIVVQLGAEWY